MILLFGLPTRGYSYKTPESYLNYAFGILYPLDLNVWSNISRTPAALTTKSLTTVSNGPFIS